MRSRILMFLAGFVSCSLVGRWVGHVVFDRLIDYVAVIFFAVWFSYKAFHWMLGFIVSKRSIASWLNTPVLSVEKSTQEGPNQVRIRPARSRSPLSPKGWLLALFLMAIFAVTGALWNRGDGWLGKNSQAGWGRPDVIVTVSIEKITVKECGGTCRISVWLGRGWESLGDFVELLADLWTGWNVTDKPRRGSAPLPFDMARDRVELLVIAQQAAADSHEMERQQHLEEIQLFLLSELADLIKEGAGDGKGCVAFTRYIANSAPGLALGLPSLDLGQCIALAMDTKVPVPHFRYPDGRTIVEAPTLALRGGLGYSMNYDVDKGWHIIWTAKFRKLASKPN